MFSISAKNVALYASETDEEFEARMDRETSGMHEGLARGHRTKSKARRTRAKAIMAELDRKVARWEDDMKGQLGQPENE